jgi:hypothetical protein
MGKAADSRQQKLLWICADFRNLTIWESSPVIAGLIWLRGAISRDRDQKIGLVRKLLWVKEPTYA